MLLIGVALSVVLGLTACSGSVAGTAAPAGQSAGTTGQDTSGPPESSPAPTTTAGASTGGTATGGTLPAGPITLVSLGDSLTAGQGEDPERSYPDRLRADLEAAGRAGSTAVNLGRSGWDSAEVISGADGDGGQLPAALDAIAQAKQESRPVIATLLIGSNDLWRLYAPDGDSTTAEQEQQNLDTYRSNVTRIVGDLRAAGALVVIGINDDQSRRPAITDPAIRQNTVPGITDAEAVRMTAQATRFAEVVRTVAAANDALVVDFFTAPFFTDPALLAEDGMHPNAKGYDRMAVMWWDVIRPLL